MLNIFFPKLCNSCKCRLLQTEEVLCGSCRHALPMVRNHETGDTSVKRIFNGRVAITNATSLLQFHKKGITQELLHDLKYRKQQSISFFFGKWLGAELAEIAAYKKVNLVIPVPIHKKKKRIRGYNQVSGFGIEIAKALQVPFSEAILLKTSVTSSQVFKQRFTRFNNKESFKINNEHLLEGKHVLLVDDIITTGATLEACANFLLQHGASEISLATIAVTL